MAFESAPQAPKPKNTLAGLGSLGMSRKPNPIEKTKIGVGVNESDDFPKITEEDIESSLGEMKAEKLEQFEAKDVGKSERQYIKLKHAREEMMQRAAEEDAAAIEGLRKKMGLTEQTGKKTVEMTGADMAAIRAHAEEMEAVRKAFRGEYEEEEAPSSAPESAGGRSSLRSETTFAGKSSSETEAAPAMFTLADLRRQEAEEKKRKGSSAA
jgi:hypothetical protein